MFNIEQSAVAQISKMPRLTTRPNNGRPGMNERFASSSLAIPL